MTKSRCLLILVALLAFSITGPLWAAEPSLAPAAPAVAAPDQAALTAAIFAPAEKAQQPAEPDPVLPNGLRIEDLTPTPVPVACTNSWCQSLGCYICRNGLCLC